MYTQEYVNYIRGYIARVLKVSVSKVQLDYFSTVLTAAELNSSEFATQLTERYWFFINLQQRNNEDSAVLDLYDLQTPASVVSVENIGTVKNTFAQWMQDVGAAPENFIIDTANFSKGAGSKGDFEVLWDEPILAGDPKNGAGGTPTGPKWQPGGDTSDRWGFLELDKVYNNVQIYAHAEFGDPGHEIEIASWNGATYDIEYNLDLEGQGWVGGSVFSVNPNTDKVRIRFTDNGAFVPCPCNEIVVYSDELVAGASDSQYLMDGFKITILS